MSVKWHSNSPEFQYTCSSGAQPGRASHVRMSVSHTHGPGRQGEKHHAPSEHHHTPEQGEPTLSPSEDTKEIVRGCSALWSSFKSPSSKRIHTADSGLPRWLSGKESSYQGGDKGSVPGLGKIPCRRKWQPTPEFLPGKSYGQRSLAGYSPWGHKESRDNWATKQRLQPSWFTLLCCRHTTQ